MNEHLRAIRWLHLIATCSGLSPEQVGPDVLLAPWRDHWLIENRPHRRRNVILRQDHSTFRSGTSPHAMAALRNTVFAIAHDLAEPLTEIRESFAENTLQAIAATQRGFLNDPAVPPGRSLTCRD